MPMNAIEVAHVMVQYQHHVLALLLVDTAVLQEEVGLANVVDLKSGQVLGIFLEKVLFGDILNKG